MNKVMLMGRMVKDPEMRQTTNGIDVARFSLAVNRRFAKEGQQQTDFITCIAWRQTADFICKYFGKGSMIAICGSIQTRSWDDKDGNRQYATEVVADEAYFTGSKFEQQSNTHSEPSNDSEKFEGFDDFSDMDSFEDDLPF